MTRRICFVVPVHPSFIMGGAQYQVQLIIEELLKEGGFEIHYITERAGDVNTLPYHVHQLKRQSGLLGSQVLNRRKLLALLHELNPDVIYQRLAGGYTGICAEYSKSTKTPLIFHIAHEFDVNLQHYHRRGPLGFLENRVQRYGIKHADYVIAQTKNQQLLLQQHFKRDVEMVMYNAHPMPAEKRISKMRDTPHRILWIGIQRPMKQPELFIDLAWHYRDRTDLQFVMIGKMMGKASFRAQLQGKMDNLKNLEYMGEVTQEEVNRQLLSAHLLVNTSLQEGFSNTFIQAWLRGVQVLSLNSDPDYLLSRNPILGCCSSGDFSTLVSQFNNLVASQERDANTEKLMEFTRPLFSLQNLERLMPLLKGSAS